MSTRNGIAGIFVAALLVGGCDGGDDDSAAPGDPAPTSEVGDGLSTTEATGAQADADAAVLRLVDVPAGWQEQPAEDRPDFEATWQDLLRCGGVDAPSASEMARAESATFISPPATQASSTVVYLEDREQARELVEALTGSGALARAQQAFAADVERNAPEGATVGQVEVQPLELAEPRRQHGRLSDAGGHRAGRGHHPAGHGLRRRLR